MTAKPKGRGSNPNSHLKKGEAHLNAKLTETSVKFMRLMWSDGHPLKAIADEFKVSIAGAQKAISGETWGHVK